MMSTLVGTDAPAHLYENDDSVTNESLLINWLVVMVRAMLRWVVTSGLNCPLGTVKEQLRLTRGVQRWVTAMLPAVIGAFEWFCGQDRDGARIQQDYMPNHRYGRTLHCGLHQVPTVFKHPCLHWCSALYGKGLQICHRWQHNSFGIQPGNPYQLCQLLRTRCQYFVDRGTLNDHIATGGTSSFESVSCTK